MKKGKETSERAHGSYELWRVAKLLEEPLKGVPWLDCCPDESSVTTTQRTNEFYIQSPRFHDNRVEAPYPIEVSLSVINRPEVHKWRTNSVL